MTTKERVLKTIQDTFQFWGEKARSNIKRHIKNGIPILLSPKARMFYAHEGVC